MSDSDDVIGYSQAASAYWDAGWRGILPLDRGVKWPPPEGFTGGFGADPSYPDILQWSEKFPDGNLCLRLPDGIVGIDVDAYGAKTGATALAEAEKRWGKLPPAPYSSSRDNDKTSGIRLFQVPLGTRLKGRIDFHELGIGDIEIVQRHHRYVICWPSIHPEGRNYWWRNPVGQLIGIPKPDELPILPTRWIEKLQVTPNAPLLIEACDVRETFTAGEPSPLVSTRLRQAILELNMPGQCRHDAGLRHSLALMGLGKRGEPGALKALQTLRAVFVSVVTMDGSRSTEDAGREFERFLTNPNAAVELSQPSSLDWMGLPPSSNRNNGQVIDADDSTTSDPQQTWHDNNVLKKVYELRVADEARAMWNRQRATLMGQDPPTMVSLPDFLAVPDEDVIYRVENLFPVGARILLAAQYKAGKTSMIANLLRCLVDGDRFLGRFTVAPIERVLLIDTELDERTLRRWLREQGIRNTDGINVLSLRGRLASFAITDDRVRADWAMQINSADLIILDCLRPCLDALGLSEDKEAGVFLTAFDALCRESGTGEAVVVHHMGHSEERSRGDSRLLDWPDALWKLVREQNAEGGTVENGDRFFSAIGRDVNVGESQLDWQPETRTLTICGGNRTEKRARSAIADLIEIMHDESFVNGASKNQLVNHLKTYGHGRNVARAAVEAAIIDNALYTEEGARGAILCHLNPSRKRS